MWALLALQFSLPRGSRETPKTLKSRLPFLGFHQVKWELHSHEHTGFKAVVVPQLEGRTGRYVGPGVGGNGLDDRIGFRRIHAAYHLHKLRLGEMGEPLEGYATLSIQSHTPFLTGVYGYDVSWKGHRLQARRLRWFRGHLRVFFTRCVEPTGPGTAYLILFDRGRSADGPGGSTAYMATPWREYKPPQSLKLGEQTFHVNIPFFKKTGARVPSEPCVSSFPSR